MSTVMNTNNECIQTKEDRLARQRQTPNESLSKGVRYETNDNYCMETSNNSKQLGTFYLDMESLDFVTRFDLSISI